MSIQIEKNIPIPAVTRAPYGEYSKVLANMEVGDSFTAEGDNMGTLQSRIRQSAKSLGIKITARKIEEGKLRVWRVADEAQQ